MNDEQLKPIEAAARAYCAKIGADPDQQIPMPHPVFPGAKVGVARWQIEAGRLLDLSRMLTALKEGAATPKIMVQ